jgi:hypothetical protein
VVFSHRTLFAKVAELVDAPDLGSGAEKCGGSSPPFRNFFLCIFHPAVKIATKARRHKGSPRGLLMNRSKKHIRNIPIGLLVFLLFAIPGCRFEKGPEKEPERVWGLRGKTVALAKSLAGLPYRYGGQEIDGFDCSGFIYYVYDCFGVKLPRTAEGQAGLKDRIKLKYAKPADILVFKFGSRWHTALYIGGNSFIHAPEKKERLRVESLNDFWKDHLEYVIQVIEE